MSGEICPGIDWQFGVVYAKKEVKDMRRKVKMSLEHARGSCSMELQPSLLPRQKRRS